MNRLTEKDKQGNWQLKGLPWKCLHLGEVITTTVHDRLYGALCKLMRYEDTGLSPEQIREMDELYHKKCKEVTRLKDRLAYAEKQLEMRSESYHAEWHIQSDANNWAKWDQCSACGYKLTAAGEAKNKSMKYCPGCGREMDC